jgi:hypothetical protein
MSASKNVAYVPYPGMLRAMPFDVPYPGLLRAMPFGGLQILEDKTPSAHAI